MSSRPLTTTSFAILGLLAIQPWSTYELAQLMRRSLQFVWPRAESNLYAEPKRLVDAGLATAEVERWTDTTTPDVDWSVDAMRRVIEGEPLSDEP